MRVMSDERDRRDSWRAGDESSDPGEPGSRWVFGAMWALLALGTLVVAGPWAGFHGLLLGCIGWLMLKFPPVVALPRLWWWLAGAFVLLGAAAFLPAGWFAQPEWRQRLAALGVDTGPLVAIQARQAAEALALFAITLFGGLWLAGHRSSPSQLRQWALAFTLGVAAYAILSKILQNTPHGGHPGTDAHFGFFPNRNHTATYLAMGAICGLGCVFQALRDKRFVGMAMAIVATLVCLWAVAGWSKSRGGVVLVAIGCLIWLPMLGKRYLGIHGLRALGLIGLVAVGLFFIADSGVKDRFAVTLDKASDAVNAADSSLPEQGKSTVEAAHDLDFRIPTALDTLNLIRDFKWTGIGAGQYCYIFPQYRHLAAVANDQDNYHPESDWLWVAAEAGLPATLVLAVLVLLVFSKSVKEILSGRDRAVRCACLVAAMLVPIHGLFDVPGHRITLAWSAAWLLALSLRMPPADPRAAAPPNPLPFRIVALTLLGFAAWLLVAQWVGGPQPALATASTALHKAHDLFQEDQKLQRAALAKEHTYQPAAADDPLEKALAVLSKATPLAPLDRDLLRYQAFLALHYDDKYDLVERSFAIERALDPTWIAGPLLQAQAWAPHDPQRCVPLWTEALRRAAQVDLLQPDTLDFGDRTLQRIREFAKGKPELENLVPVPE